MSGVFREHVIKRFTRSSGWSKIRKEYLSENPSCCSCGKSTKGMMQVHHIVPFHINPELELDKSNLMTLCSNPRCHLDKGHLGSFRSWNEYVREDCQVWRRKYKNRP